MFMFIAPAAAKYPLPLSWQSFAKTISCAIYICAMSTPPTLGVKVILLLLVDNANAKKCVAKNLKNK